MLKELKEEMHKDRKTTYEQNENINKEIEIIKRIQKEILELKNIITEMKISLERYKMSFEQGKERIRKLED